MATYPGPIVGGPVGFITKTVCFTGTTASRIRLALTILGGIEGALGGFFAGIVIRYVLKLRLPAEMLLTALQRVTAPAIGAVLGAITGVAAVLIIVRRGACTCPPGKNGFCLDFYYTGLPPSGSPQIPIPIITPNAAACATVVPAGCP